MGLRRRNRELCQTLVAQDAELHRAGAAKVYRETVSGAASNRPQLAKLLRVISEGDVVLMTGLDRLARSTRDLLNVLDKIGQAGASFKSLRETWADTTSPAGRLMITVIGGIAEFERELIRARTGDGIKRAKAAGVHMGRPSKLSKHQQREAPGAAQAWRGDLGRDRPDLQRQPHDDLATQGAARSVFSRGVLRLAIVSQVQSIQRSKRSLTQAMRKPPLWAESLSKFACCCPAYSHNAGASGGQSG